MKLTIDHYGILTPNVNIFEAFWCGVLGYEQAKDKDGNPYETHMTKDKCFALFRLYNQFLIRRYTHPTLKPDIEMHMFKDREYIPGFDYCDGYDHFAHWGFNHICLHTGGKGSREEFMEKLPADVERVIYDDPQGWQNIFIKDYEGNNIELRETF